MSGAAIRKGMCRTRHFFIKAPNNAYKIAIHERNIDYLFFIDKMDWNERGK